jgi:DNA-binding beta-propeller fold protein YncE
MNPMPARDNLMDRRRFAQRLCAGGGLLPLLTAGLLSNGCLQSQSSGGLPDKVYGKFGYGPGQFQKPRAITIDSQNEIYIVDMTGRIQVFDAEGNFLRFWRTPAVENGRPTGISVDDQGTIWVADTHYYQALAYSRIGEMNQERSIFGKPGIEPGMFGMLTEVALDSRGRILIGEYGENDRIQVFYPDRTLAFQIGAHGTEPGQFMRPQCLTVDDQDQVWVADSGNHRIQAFQLHDDHATLVKVWGSGGTAPGQMRFPYDIFFDQNNHLFVCEFGNHRVQKFDRDGNSLWLWKSPGSGPSALYQPWGCVMDQQSRLHILDSYHHRVYRVPTA